MRLSDLQNKDIVNISDGKKIGNIIDMRIDMSGNIISIIVEPSKRVFKFLGVREELEISWEDIEKVGEDVILISINL